MENEYFSKRRSVRKFLKRDISDDLLQEMVGAAMKAPTTGNMQLYTIIVTRDSGKKGALAALHYNQPAASAPVLLTVCADFARFTRWCELRGADAGFDNFLSFTSAFADALIFTQQLATIAELNGLGTCYLGTVIYNAPEIANLLKCPRLVMPVATLALGYPAEDGQPTERLPLRAVMHEEEYREDSDEAVLDFFRVKEEYPGNEKFVEENCKDNLAQVFSEVRYPRGMNEEISAKLLKWLHSNFFGR